MSASVDFLSFVVGSCLLITALTPVILIALFIRDWIKEALW